MQAFSTLYIEASKQLGVTFLPLLSCFLLSLVYFLYRTSPAIAKYVRMSPEMVRFLGVGFIFLPEPFQRGREGCVLLLPVHKWDKAGDHTTLAARLAQDGTCSKGGHARNWDSISGADIAREKLMSRLMRHICLIPRQQIRRDRHISRKEAWHACCYSPLAL